ncbi:hypothetical protein BC936DRAFT_138075 [Jimgerdemannia flammicorona]|uniref:Nucleoside diphosphate kinase n=1 Tax=Jimgerdemannia flammicorona TaxID=994334 RepID=A0A433DN01_9FUNG|nr:hypothetical protein BC936DRAFT_138075 [Jimgerdemannia flammicorona]
MPPRPLPQLTLALFKPDVCANPLLPPRILDAVRARDFDLVALRELLWARADAEQFYAEHRDRFFFERLCGYMTSGPFQALILSKPDAIKSWRALIGPTHPVRARLNSPDTLRALYGLTDTRNSFHGSDSEKTAWREIGFFFPEFDVDAWRATAGGK